MKVLRWIGVIPASIVGMYITAVPFRNRRG